MIRVALLALALLAAPASARERVVAALDQNRIAISAGFDGSEVLIYGALAGVVDVEGLGVAVRLTGPPVPVAVHKKTRVMGIWTNAEALNAPAAPSYFAVATTGPFFETLTPEEDRRWEVSADRAMRALASWPELPERAEFLAALTRLRREAGRYIVAPGGVELIEGALFRTRFELPADIEEGVYDARILLTRDGRVIDVFETEVNVAKVGVERWLHDLAMRQPWLYGIGAVAAALLTGLFVAEGFRLLRR